MVKDCMTHQRGFVISFKSDKSDNINFGIEKEGLWWRSLILTIFQMVY